MSSSEDVPTGLPRVERFRGDPRAAADAADSYAGLAIHALPGLHAHVAGMLQRLLPAGRVLDVAAGSGAMSQRLLDAGYEVEAVEYAIEHFALGDEVRCHALDLNRPDFPSAFAAPFDGIVAMEIIEHLENPRAFLRGLCASLKPGGFIVLTTPNIDNPVSRALHCRLGHSQWFADQHVEELGHITPLDARLLHQAVGDVPGLEVVELGSFGDPWHEVKGWLSLRVLARFLQRVGGREPSLQGEAVVAVLQRDGAA